MKKKLTAYNGRGIHANRLVGYGSISGCKILGLLFFLTAMLDEYIVDATQKSIPKIKE